MKILLVDDHAIIRRGVSQHLAETWPDAVFGEASCAQQALELVWKEPWSIVILDINLPGRSGLDIIRDLKDAQPKMPILVLSMHAEEQFAIRVLKSGASGYVTKDTLLQDLSTAVAKVVSGGRYLSSALAEILAGALAGKEQIPHERLSDREFQILLLLARGTPIKEISAQLTLSVSTVSTYRLRLMGKMNLSSNADLVQYAMQNGLLG